MNPKQIYRGPTTISNTISSAEALTETNAFATGHEKTNSPKVKVESPLKVQRKTAEEDETVQRKEKGKGKSKVSAGFQSAVDGSRGNGNNLDQGTQQIFGAKFGADFKGVKVHNNHKSHKMASEINARAFTVGQDIYFNYGEYQPETYSGKKLLAHELTHTLQQKGAAEQVQKQDGEKETTKPKTAQGIIDANTSYYNLDEMGLGRELHSLASTSAQNYKLVIDVFKLLDSSNKKEVSDGMIDQIGRSEIVNYTRTAEGRQFLQAISGFMTQGGPQQKRLLKLFPTESEITEFDREAAAQKLKEKGNTAEINFYPDYEGMSDAAEESLKGIGIQRGKAPDTLSFGVDEFEEIKLYLEIVSERHGNAENFIRVLHFLGHGRGGDDAAFGFGRYMTGLDNLKAHETGAYSRFIADGGSVLMEGCSVAQGAGGKQYLKEVARITFGNDKTGYIRGNQCNVMTSGEITTCDPITMRWPSDF